MNPGIQVAILIADLAAWVLIMVIIGKWPVIRKWFRTTVFRRVPAQGDA
jgi:hypothetical protein